MRYRTVKRKRKGKKRILCLLFIVLLLIVVKVFIGNSGIWGQSASMEHGWNLMLVNQDYRVPRNYKVELTELSNGQSVDSRIYPSLQQMFDDMRAQGVYPTVASGYRTSKKQQSLMDEKIESFIAQGYSRSDATTEALKWVSAVGYSEHQMGLAVDINANCVNSTGKQVYDWLADNAWEYGFILRYPADKTEITHTSYEPWHYRYVGTEAAKVIFEQSICLEEYIEMLN